jgi:hypothetical protein
MAGPACPFIMARCGGSDAWRDSWAAERVGLLGCGRAGFCSATAAVAVTSSAPDKALLAAARASTPSMLDAAGLCLLKPLAAALLPSLASAAAASPASAASSLSCFLLPDRLLPPSQCGRRLRRPRPSPSPSLPPAPPVVQATLFYALLTVDVFSRVSNKCTVCDNSLVAPCAWHIDMHGVQPHACWARHCMHLITSAIAASSAAVAALAVTASIVRIPVAAAAAPAARGAAATRPLAATLT